MEKDVYIDEFFRLPSITGKDVIDLEVYAKLPRTKSYDAVKAFLEESRKSSKDVNIRFIVAEWGEGKTSICEGLLKKPDVIKSDIVIPISTKRLILHIKEKKEFFSDTGSLGARFLAYLLYTIKDVVENELFSIPPFDKIKIKSKSPEQRTVDFIRDGLKSILNVLDSNSRIFIFLDEFEDIVDEPVDIRSFVKGGLLDVMGGSPTCLTEEPFAGRLHMLISATPPAYEKIKSEIPADSRRFFGQRALPIELEKLNRKSAYQYILGILKYCWEGRLSRIPFCEPGMFNAIYLSTLGNPRSIVNLLKILLTHAKISAPEGKIKCIQPKDFIYAILDQRIEVYGGEVHLIDRSVFNRLYERLENKCKKLGLDFDKCVNIVYLLLANLSPISIKEIGQRINENPYDYISVIGSCFQEIWGIERPFLYFKKVIGEASEIYSKIISPEAPLNLRKVIEALEFYEFNQKDLTLREVLYVPHQQLSKLAIDDRPLFQNYIDLFTTFSPELRDEGEIRVLVDRYIIDKVRKSEEDYIMLSQAAINLFYPSPSFFFLDFIEDLDKRFKIGMQLTRNLTSFEKEFQEGIIRLIMDGGQNKEIKIERFFEPRGVFKDVEVIRLSYSEALQQYNVRVRIFSPLRISEDDFRKRIEAIANEMKEACIPILLVFSWNPLPLEAKSILETFFGPERGSERVFYYLEFPLTEFQCHQIIGYILALENKYKIKEERWKVRASKILDEIKFESIIKDFIRNGVNSGYTLGQITQKELKLDELPGFLRTLLITEGDIEKRWSMIELLEKKFRIYGKDFPICPESIDSKIKFEKCINELKSNGFVIEKDGSLEVRYTPIERRILSILREYNRPLSKDEINDLFISAVSPGLTSSIEIYLRILEERRKVYFDKKKGYSLYDMSALEKRFRELKEEVKKLKDRYADFSYGFLTSIKQRNISTIILRDCINDLEELIKTLEMMAHIPEPEYEEKRIGKQILLETLMYQVNEIVRLIDNFYKEYLPEYRDFKLNAKSLIVSLNELEKSFNNLPFINRKLIIKEKDQISEKLALIEEIEKKIYTADEMESLALKLKDFIYGLERKVYDAPKHCPIFDIKIVQIMYEIKKLNETFNKYDELKKRADEEIRNIIVLRDSINNHRIFTSQYEGLFSLALQEWVRRDIKKGG